MNEVCIIVDFGSQFTQLIARKLRELGVYSEIVAPTISFDDLRKKSPKGIILSGGPSSVRDSNAPSLSFSLDKMEVPVLGICYGMQWIVHSLGARVEAGLAREYGVEEIEILESDLFPKGQTTSVLMSHGDHAESCPAGYTVTARSTNGSIAAIENRSSKIYGLQFHPEVHHTPQGRQFIERFLEICDFSFSWKSDQIVDLLSKKLHAQVGDGRILCALSGGVDSTVVAVLLHRLFPNQVDCICVDTGLLRKNELKTLQNLFESRFHFPIQLVNASQEFLSALAGIRDPEKKRKIIGKVFIDVFERESLKLKDIKFLAQGTLYPDVIESVSVHGGPSSTIKSHHNVGGLPERLPFKLVEPLRDLFKDEVRRIGEFLGLPREFVWRHPFPGPGLGIRIMGDITEARLEILKEADDCLQEVLKQANWYERLWQSFCVYLPIQSVGVMGDQRTYEDCIVVRCVESEDGMTASVAALPPDLLDRISRRIIAQVKGINRVVYDISSKPPATIEWE